MSYKLVNTNQNMQVWICQLPFIESVRECADSFDITKTCIYGFDPLNPTFI